MNSQEQGDTQFVEIPDDAVATRQSNWAFLWPTVPWLILFVVTLTVDFLSFGVLPAVIAMVVIGSRYMSFRKTLYILTGSHIVIQQGSLMGQHRLDVPFVDLKDMVAQPGMFGRSLGYTRLTLQLKDDRGVFLSYVPLESPFLDNLRKQVDFSPSQESSSKDVFEEQDNSSDVPDKTRFLDDK